MHYHTLPHPKNKGKKICTKDKIAPQHKLSLCSNSQRKAHQIAQIRHLEPQKRQYTTNEVDLR